MKALFFLLCILLASILAFPTCIMARELAEKGLKSSPTQCSSDPNRSCAPPHKCPIYKRHC
ncbi:hypothetical protein F383_31980 [Gossypium arboreum]|uniref:Uncharacterized protein n=5 Tax=Gossypium TaxID=3633 RepID=A0A0B0PMW1_GOSAR|nr:hypothetical protein ES319_A04G028100v1 [Gossypium barbadense]KHG26310.1 hypothetical protein F383_31980 [Gossypium arboreum]TYH21316.1 hypothetical protein ES288_A04G034200v1 [Gossypium darwinii]TYI32101.1 hypothetical protein ES332_A04G034700v1 [Gossypium tomentosum]TYJ38958.1 hypothetical protein E1A91_A04G030900v1 [Gossypium mustelinum]